jgi:hypothetical protein
MSTPESTAETSDHGMSERTKQDALTHTVGTPLTVPEAKLPWWKRLFGRG